MTAIFSDLYDATSGSAILAEALDTLLGNYEGSEGATSGSARVGYFIIGNSIRFFTYPRFGGQS